MPIMIDVLAPQLEAGTSAIVLARWLKGIGQPVFQNEPIAELLGTHARAYAHAPHDGTLSEMHVQPGQNILVGHLIGRISAVSKDSIDWDNFDEVTAIVEDFGEKSKDMSQIKDANEALGQLLGVTDKPIFQNMSVEQQNVFLQSVVDESKSGGLSSAAVTHRLLVGLHLRMPANAPRAPGPSLGMHGPTGPGMGGGGGYSGGSQPQQAVPQPHAYPSYPAYPQGMPPQHGQQHGYWPPPQGQDGGFPPPYPPYPAVDPHTGQPMPYAPPPVMAQPVMPPQQQIENKPAKEDDKDKE